MNDWRLYGFVTIVFWGVVGILQKLGTNRVSADSLIVWLMAGYVLLLPFLLLNSRLLSLSPREALLGTLVGVTNGLGAWFLFASLESGGKASVAVPLTALYPLVTNILAVIFLAERLTPTQWVGVTLALVSAVLISYSPEPDGGFSDE